MKTLVILALTAIISSAVILPAESDSLDDFVIENLTTISQYKNDIPEYIERYRSKKTITNEDRTRYSNAYTYYAWKYYKQNDPANALRYISYALRLAPKNPNTLFVAGCFSEKNGDFASAVAYLQSASILGNNSVKKSADIRLDAIASGLIDDAKALADNNRFTEANERLIFVAERFSQEWREQAVELADSYKDEINAAQILMQAQQMLRMRRRGDAQRTLRELTTKYSWTHAAEEAQKILRQSHNLFVKAKGDSLFAEAAAIEKWKILETDNFIIYYRNSVFAKEAAKVIEKVFKQVVEELDLKNVSWRNSKCRIFLFDNNDTWTKFKKSTGLVTEWAAAFAVPGEREIYGNASQGKRLLQSTLPHELTHLIHGEYLDGRSIAPLWLSEGLAVHHQFDTKLMYYKIVQKYIDEGSSIPLEKLTSLKKYPQTDVHYFYAASMTFVEFIIEQYGSDVFTRLNRYVKQRRGSEIEFKKICSRFLKARPEDIEKKWKEFVIKKADGFSR